MLSPILLKTDRLHAARLMVAMALQSSSSKDVRHFYILHTVTLQNYVVRIMCWFCLLVYTDKSVCAIPDASVNNGCLSVWVNRIFAINIIMMWLRLMKNIRAFRYSLLFYIKFMIPIHIGVLHAMLLLYLSAYVNGRLGSQNFFWISKTYCNISSNSFVLEYSYLDSRS